MAALLLCGPALAQAPAGPGPAAASPAPAVPDTQTAVLAPPEGTAAPGNWVVVPDTVTFGGTVALVPAEGPAVPLESGTEWLEPVPAGEEIPPAGWTGEDAPPPGSEFRVYRVDPFRLAVGDWTSRVITVRGRAGGTDDIAGVRTPPWPGLPWGPFAGLAAAAALLALAVLWLWNRRRGPAEWPDRALAAPVWLETAPGLRDLVAAGLLARGDGRGFLDGLAALARRYVGGRYGIAAAEMTGREMVAACRRLGYPLGPVRSLAGLIDDADRRRYDPESPTPARCREQAVEFFRQVQATRIVPRHTPASAERILAADQAWTAVARELDPSGRLLAGSRGGRS